MQHCVQCSTKYGTLAPPLLIGLAVDVVVQKEESFLAGFGIENAWHQLILLSVLTFIIWGLESLFEYFYGILWRNLAQTVQHELRLETFSHVQKQGMGWFDERQKGDVLAILNDDINQLERFLDKGANDLASGDNNCYCCRSCIPGDFLGGCHIRCFTYSSNHLGLFSVPKKSRTKVC